MLDIIKSKMMMGVAVMLLGIVFVNAGVTNKLEENHAETYEKVIVMNIQ